jgi:hypothetical protein
MFKRIVVYILSTALYPLIVLQALSYRLIGIEAKCEWGYAQAQPASQPTKNQVMFATTFPHIFLAIVAIVLIVLAQAS